MKAYGVKRRDRGCCPGHDKFPRETYANNDSKRAQARDTKLAHGIARARSREELQALCKHESELTSDGSGSYCCHCGETLS
jgi:hypothetical protein